MFFNPISSAINTEYVNVSQIYSNFILLHLIKLLYYNVLLIYVDFSYFV